MKYKNKRTGAVQEVKDNETLRRGILERLGWAVVEDAAVEAQAGPVVETPKKVEEKPTEPQKLPSSGQPQAKNVILPEEKKK